MQDYFEKIAVAVCTDVPGIDRVSLSYAAETTDFIRFNHARVRQVTHVDQRSATVSVVAGLRRSSGTVTLSGNAGPDVQALLEERAALVAQLPLVPEDRYLMLPDSVTSTDRVSTADLPSAEQVIEAVAQHAAATDLVGFYAGGPVVRAFADSRGQRNWHSVASFNFEWCLYRSGDQAVKSSYAGTRWDVAGFAHKMASAREQVALLERPQITLEPGEYRVYLSPVAMADLLGTLGWDGFGLKALKTGVNTLGLVHRGDKLLHPSIAISEATSTGIAPCFQQDGFVKPGEVALVDQGRTVGTLNSARSASEYVLPANGANAYESPESLALAAGTLAQADILRTLGTGIQVSNLHYLNY
ncbi:MAG: metallopeptidase TldD-related protein, partial [Ramlibacter sp.]|nr:metallopeptidase TldD-related protein [Ramlibacter sp.]